MVSHIFNGSFLAEITQENERIKMINTQVIKEAATTGFSSILGYNSVTEEEFDRWLQAELAEAWDRGKKSNEIILTSLPPQQVRNPYRKF